MLAAKYGEGDGWNLMVPRGALRHSPWRAIMHHSCEFMGGLEFEVGNGRCMKFWLDSWCDGRTLALDFLDIFSMIVDPNAVVASYASNAGGC